jgi:cbb3-type cytochrome oxidase subunit 3
MKTFGIVYIVIFSLIFLGIVYFLYEEWKRLKKAEESRYELTYKKLQEMIRSYPVVPGNYEVISKELERLRALKHKNEEKTQVLAHSFYIKFQN